MFGKRAARSGLRWTVSRLWFGVLVLAPVVLAACNQNGGRGY